MQFFRRNRVAARLALLALAAQLVLSFGHIHDHAAHAAVATASDVCAGKTTAPCPAHGDDDRFCSICWTMNIAGSLVLPAPVALEIPTFEPPSLQPARTLAALATSGTVPFQARAPPVAGTLS